MMVDDLMPGDLVFSLSPPAARPLVTLKGDGTVEFGPDYTPDEAARAFWEGVAAHNPLLAEVERLTAALAAERALADELDEALRRFVHAGTGDAKLIAWRRVAECRAAWRAARQEGGG